LIRSGSSTGDQAAMVVCERRTAAKQRQMVVPSSGFAGSSPEKVFSSYCAPIAMRIGPGGR
jgi:hypothetical protein